jgi:tRNA threonylcarbamoyladenosine biosynthesis protein TsaB
MTNILTLDTSTDACSVCLRVNGDIDGRCELIPRQHNHRLFTMLADLLPAGGPAAVGLDFLSYAQGPGSFTGLRIAASAIQGLAYSLKLPVAGVSSLACLAQGALRRGLVTESDTVLAMIDARINEIYWGVYGFDCGVATAVLEDCVSAPGDVPETPVLARQPLVAMGSGLCHFEQLPRAVRSAVCRQLTDQWPDSLDLLPLADRAYSEGDLLSAEAVQPVYLRNEIHWKKLSEQ